MLLGKGMGRLFEGEKRFGGQVVCAHNDRDFSWSCVFSRSGERESVHSIIDSNNILTYFCLHCVVYVRQEDIICTNNHEIPARFTDVLLLEILLQC